jgi:hypothetical protein
MDSLRDNFGKYDVSRLVPKAYVFHQVRVSEALLGPERAITSHAGRLGPGETGNAIALVDLPQHATDISPW